MKTLILGIGNTCLGDDGVGVHVARKLKTQINDSSIIVDEAFTGGMNLLDLMLGYERAILIDACPMPHEQPGQIHLFTKDNLPQGHSANPHDTSLWEALEMANRLGEKAIPQDITLVAITLPIYPREFSDTLSQPIADAIPRAMATVTSLLCPTDMQYHNEEVKHSNGTL